MKPKAIHKQYIGVILNRRYNASGATQLSAYQSSRISCIIYIFFFLNNNFICAVAAALCVSHSECARVRACVWACV